MRVFRSSKLAHTVSLLAVVCGVGPLGVARAESPAPLRKIGEMELSLVGLSARVEPARLVVPKNVASGVRIVAVAGGQELAAAELARLLGGVFEARAELQGPGLPGAFELKTSAADPDPLLLPLPPLPIAGDYELTNVRLVAPARTLDVAPRVEVQVIDQILVTSVKTRALTLDEIKEKGIVLDSDDYLGFEFTIGLQLESKPVDFKFPVVFDREGVVVPELLKPPPPPFREGVLPPTFLPMLLEAVGPVGEGGAQEKIPLTLPGGGGPIRIPSVVVIPGNVAFLKQFFSAQLFVANGAPGGSGLVVRDVKGKLKLPPGPDGVTSPPGSSAEDLGDDPLSLPKVLRNGETITQPSELPLRGLGPDGQPDTADDEDALPPAAQGQAEFLIRGEKEGYHTVDFDLTATLAGLPIGPVQVSGKAQGGLLVRNASFDMTFTVPGVVRTGEKFKLFATLTNVGKGIGNKVEVALDGLGLSGATLVNPDDAVQTIATLLPGDAQTVEFLFESEVTGQVVASYLDFDDRSAGGATVTGRMRFTLGVGERGVPLSPDTLVLPTSVDALVNPDTPVGEPSVVDAAMRVLGQAWSIANAPSGSLPKGVLRTSKAVVTQKALALAEAGLRVSLGQDREDAVRDLAFDFFGGTPLDPGFDQLLRQTEAGRSLVVVLGRELAAAATGLGLPAFEEEVAQFAASGADFVTFAVGTSAANPFTVSLEDGRGRRTETEASGTGLPSWAVPGAAFLPLGEGEAPPLLGLVTAPTAAPYVLHLRGREPGAADVAVTFPDGKGGFVRAVLFGLELPVGAEARLVLDPARPGSVRLDRDDDGDGVFTRETVSTTALVLVGPALVSARVIGPEVLAGASPLGNQLAILFDRVVDEKAAADVASYGMVDNAVRVARRQLSGRLVFGALERPEGRYVPVRLSVDGMKDTRGTPGSGGEVDLLSLLVDPGAVVSGRVLTAEGDPAVPGRIVYTATSTPKGAFPCRLPEGVAAVPLDGNGRYELRYVRQDPCGGFSIVAQDPATKARSEVRASVRAAGERIELDIVLFGRGSVAGQVRARASGQPIPGAKVVAVSVTDPQIGGATTTDAEGRYLVPGITVGPVSVRAAKGIAAGLGAGRIDRAGTTATVDVLLDTGSVTWSGVVRSKKGAAAAVTVPGVQVVYYVDGTPVGVTRTDANGKFAFTAMPAGNTKVRAALSLQDVAEVLRVTAEGDVITQDLLILMPEDAELGTVRGVVRFPDGRRAGGMLVRAGSRGALTSKPTDGVPETGGEFVLSGVPLGDTFVAAESPDGKRSGSARVTLSAEARDVATAITLSGLGTAVFTVVDPLGQPVKDAQVRLLDCADDPCGCTSAKTLADGTVEFEDLKVGSVQAKAFFGGDVATASASVTRDADRGVGILRFGGNGTIEGIVLDHRGLPALGADLEVYSKIFVNDGASTCGLVPRISYRFRTREDGRFRFTGVSAGAVSVTASQAFYPTRVGQQVVLLHGRTEALTLRLVNSMAGAFTGLVYLPDGETLAGKGVEVTADGPLPEVVVKTDDTGQFRFAKILPEGLYTVTVRDPVTSGVVREMVYLRANEPAERDFRLKGKGEVRVRVVDGADEPVGVAFVRLREEEYPNRFFERAIDTSNEGVAVFPNVFEGPVSLEASDSFARGGRASTVLPGPGRVVEVKVRLTVTGKVFGRFRRPDGTPIPLGVVRLFVAGRPFGQITTSSAADDVGRFAFDYVPAGPVVLEAQDPLTARTGRATGSLASEGEVLELDVFAQALGTVEGLVTSNDAPQPGALVEVTSGSFKATTDADGEGRYRLQGVPGGRVVVKASLAQGFLAGTAGGDLTEDGSVLSLDVALRGSARVRGSVVAYDGSHPLSRVTIRSGGLGGAILATLTDENGLFEVDRVPAGGADLGADVLDSIDQAGASVVVPEGGTLDVPPLRLPGLGTVEVRVVDALGSPVDSASVTLIDASGGGRNGSLGAGVARFPQVPAGPITVRARDANQRAGTKTASLEPGTTLEVVVRLNPTFTLSGQVRERTGEGAPAGVEVRLLRPSYVTTATLDDGGFSFPFVPAGEFRLEARTAAGDRGVLDGVVLETGVAPVVLTLNGAGPVEVEVVDFGGGPVAGAQVQLSAQGPLGDLQYGATGPDGRATFPSVLRGSLTASAFARGTSDTVSAAWNDGESVQRLKATLRQLGRIEGRVLAPGGTTGVSGVTVLLGYASTASGADAAFAFDNVALGTHTLTARVNGRTRAYRDGIVVTSVEPTQSGQDLVLIGVAKVKGRVRNSQGQFGSGASVTLKSPVARFGGTFTSTANGTGQYELADVPVGPFSLVATLGSERVDRAGLAMPDPAVDLDIPIDLIADLADLEKTLYDGNGFSFEVEGDGSLSDIHGRSFAAGAPRLVVTRGAVASPFVGSSDRYVPSEEGRRELLLRQTGLAGLDVTRKVFVPNDGHFVRYLEVIENPTDSAVPLDAVAVETKLNAGYSTAGILKTASGDDTLDSADGWAVLDDKLSQPEDPDLFVNYWRFPPLAAVFADPSRPAPPAVSFSGGTLTTRFGPVTVPAQGRVAFLHAYSVRATRAGALASAARLAALPPELLQGLSREEALAVRNFAVEVGPGPAGGPTSAIAPLPPNDGKVSGKVLASDNTTPLLLNGELRPRNPFLDRPVALRSASDGTFEARANLVAEAPPSKVLVPRGDYDLVFDQLSPAALRTTATASGTFAPGSSVSTRDVVFSQTGFVTGTAKRASGAAVASARIILKTPSGAVAEVVADGFGGFRFPVVPVVPTGSHTLQAVLPAGGATTPVVPLVVGTGVQPAVSLVFSAFGSISGTMRSQALQGLTNCSAQIVVNATTRTAFCRTGGGYSFADVPPGTYTVTARDGRSQVVLTRTVSVEEGPATAVPDFVFPPVGTVKVTVRSQGSPLKSAQVYWTAPARGPAPIFAGYTDALGKISIGQVPGSGVVVEAVHPQTVNLRKASEPLEVAFDGQEVGVAIDLPAPVAVQGVFRTKDGRAVAGSQALALSADGLVTYATVNTTAEAFVLEKLPPGPILLRGRASTPAFFGSWTFFNAERDVLLPSTGGSVQEDAPLPFGRLATLGGRDLWEFEAAASAAVYVRLIGEAEGALPAPDVVVQVLGPAGQVWALGDATAKKAVDLLFIAPVTGRYVAIASARGTQTGLYKLGSALSTRVFREYTGSLVTGRVVREGDAPVLGLRVELASLPGRPFAITGPDGGFVFPAVLPGPATVEALDADGVLIGTATGEGALPDLVVPGRGTVTATATRLGVALPGLEVRFFSDHPSALAADKTRSRTSSASGVATTLLPVGLVRAEATDPVTGRIVASTALLENGASLPLPLLFPDINTFITGTVRNGDGGVVLGGARVDLRKTGAPTRTAFANANGVFSLSTVTPGSYTLTATFSSFVSAPVPLSLPTAEPSITVDLNVPIPVLRARVVEPPPSGATVPAQVRAVCGSFVQFLTAQPDGSHLFFGRPCGSQTAFTVTGRLTDGSGLEASQPVTYEVGFTGTRDVTLTLPPTGTVQVNVTDTDGAFVTVTLTDSTGLVRSLRDDGGTFTFTRVPAGLATVVALDDYGIRDEDAGTVSLGQTLVLALALPAGNLDLSLTDGGDPLIGSVFVEALDVPGGPLSRSVVLFGPTLWRVPAGAFRVRYEGFNEFDEDTGGFVFHPPAAFEGEVALGQTIPVPLEAGSHVALPTTIESDLQTYRAELNFQRSRGENPSFVQTQVQSVEPYVTPALREQGGRGLRDLQIVGPSIRVRRVRYVPQSGVFGRTLTLVKNLGPDPSVFLGSELVDTSNVEGGSIVSTSTGDASFDADDTWVVVQMPDHLFGVVLGQVPASNTDFQPAEENDGITPAFLRVGHSLDIAPGDTKAFLTFSLWQPGASPSDVDAILARAQALSDLSMAGALAGLSPSEREAILNFVVPAFGAIEGVVEDAVDARVPGARVFALRGGLIAAQVVAGSGAGDAGVFAIEDLPVGDYTLVAVHPTTNRPGRLPAVTVVEGVSQDVGVVPLLGEAEVGTVRVEGVVEGTTDPAEGAAVSLYVEGFWPAWPPVQVLGTGGVFDFTDVPAGVPAEVRGAGPWIAVPAQPVVAVAGSSTTVPVVLRYEQPTSLPADLSAGGRDYTVNADGTLSAAVSLFFGNVAWADGQPFPNGAGGFRLGGREVGVEALAVGPVTIERRVYVPPSGDFARLVDVVRNPTGADLTLSYRLERYLWAGGEGDFAVFEKSGPGLEVTKDDDWLVAHVPSGGRVVGLVLGGEGRLSRPESATWSAGSGSATITEEWAGSRLLTVPANGMAVLVQFVVPGGAGSELQVRDLTLSLSALLDPQAALFGLTSDEKAAIQNFVVP